MNNLELRNKKLEEKLKISEKKLIHKSNEVENLKRIILSNISHEIRTPLNAIMGFSSLLSQEEMNMIDKKIFLDGIHSSSERLLETISNILEASKIQSKEIKINKDDIILEDLMKDLKDYFNNEKERKGKHDIKLKIKNDISKKK